MYHYFLPFFWLIPAPLRIEEYQRKQGAETKQHLQGPPGYKSPWVTCFLFVEKGFSLLDCPSKSKQLLMREVKEF